MRTLERISLGIPFLRRFSAARDFSTLLTEGLLYSLRLRYSRTTPYDSQSRLKRRRERSMPNRSLMVISIGDFTTAAQFRAGKGRRQVY